MQNYVLKAARFDEVKRIDLGTFETVKQAYKEAFSFMRTRAFESIMIWNEEECTSVIILRWSRGFRNALTMRPMHTDQSRIYIQY